jgi:UDP-N-acetylmuramyl pentapeptide phosphotransferase/UDP-N-acetylglucosamine-1-phosphate transferase
VVVVAGGHTQISADTAPEVSGAVMPVVALVSCIVTSYSRESYLLMSCIATTPGLMLIMFTEDLVAVCALTEAFVAAVALAALLVASATTRATLIDRETYRIAALPDKANEPLSAAMDILNLNEAAFPLRENEAALA